MRLAQHHRTHQSRQHLAQSKSAVETVCRFSQIVPCILALADRMVAAADRALDVVQHDVDPARAADLTVGASPCSLRYRMRMASIGETAKTEQTIAEDLHVGRQMVRLPGLDAVVVEAANRFDHRVGRMVQSMTGLHRDQEGLFVPRAAPRLPPLRSPAG